VVIFTISKQNIILKMLFHFLIEFFALLFLQFDLNCSFNSTIVQQQQMPFLALLLSPSFSPKSSPPPPIGGRGKITTIWPIQIDDEQLKSGINSADCDEEKEEEEEENGNGRMEVDKNEKEADDWVISGETEPKTSKTIGPSNLKLPWGDGRRTTTKKGMEEMIGAGGHISGTVGKFNNSNAKFAVLSGQFWQMFY
jgi:hypothetical protein